ncbi:hypothetical protein sos41_09520 [Alphaproteobacteria bacterium SO-S41]|nr:hypothetical protein sos41_09520 [Alphaproteobacteria bacterium SO-S41]
MSKIAARLALLAAGLLLAACGSTSEFHEGFADPRVIDKGTKMQCVTFARAESGVEIYGDAHTWWDKAGKEDYDREEEPEEGSVMVLRGYKRSDRGHVAVVRRVVSDREIVVDHANWLNDGKVYLDQPVVDVSEDNDWSAVRVWYAPGHQYGARVYTVQGFIIPHLRYAGSAGRHF